MEPSPQTARDKRKKIQLQKRFNKSKPPGGESPRGHPPRSKKPAGRLPDAPPTPEDQLSKALSRGRKSTKKHLTTGKKKAQNFYEKRENLGKKSREIKPNPGTVKLLP